MPLVTRGGEENLRCCATARCRSRWRRATPRWRPTKARATSRTTGRTSTLRAIGSLYPEPVHVLIVRSDSPIASVADLAGTPRGDRTGRLRLAHDGVARARGARPQRQEPRAGARSPLNEALVGLRDKKIDAVIQVIGAPADSVRDALAEVPLRLVPLSERAVASLVASNAGYFAYTIPRGAYATQKQDVRTVATAALLLAGSDLSESEVGALTRYVFGQARDFAALGSVAGHASVGGHAQLGLSIPLHIAAARTLEGLAKPAAVTPSTSPQRQRGPRLPPRRRPHRAVSRVLSAGCAIVRRFPLARLAASALLVRRALMFVVGVRRRSRGLSPFGDRERLPIEQNGQQAEQQRRANAGCGSVSDRQAVLAERHEEHAAAERREHVELARLEQQRLVADEDVAEQTASDGIRHSDQHRGHRGDPGRERLVRADHRVNGQSYRVDVRHQPLEAQCDAVKQHS